MHLKIPAPVFLNKYNVILTTQTLKIYGVWFDTLDIGASYTDSLASSCWMILSSAGGSCLTGGIDKKFSELVSLSVAGISFCGEVISTIRGSGQFT